MREIKNNIPQVKATCIELGTPIAVALVTGVGTGSVWWGIGGAVMGLIIGFSITGSNTFGRLWVCGPRRDELSKALVSFEKATFEKSNRKNKRIYFLFGDRKCDVYWKRNNNDNSYVLAIDLPVRYWRDMIKDGDLKTQLHKISGTLCDDEHHVTAEAAEGSEEVLSMIECILEATGENLESLEVDTDLPLNYLFEVRQR